MVTIGAGVFTMGDVNGEDDEYPERPITLSAFQIDRTEVTNNAYRMCVRAKACDPTQYLDDDDLGQDDHPVVGVTWDDAANFCKWVGKRLPTEAEWECAAKGNDTRKWPWSGPFKASAANTALPDHHEKTAPVGQYMEGESPHGVLDMAGNAAEWVADYYDPTFYRTSKQDHDPKGPESGRERVVRGGSYLSSAHQVRVAARSRKQPTETSNTLGFRCAK
jgi:formylglycine-generating enzyme required for sulfatase activity